MESMDDYKDMLEASYRRFYPGDLVKGTVISVDETGALLDFNYYAPGRIAADEFSDDPNFQIMEEVSVGDEITAVVVKVDDGAGNLVLSKKQANHETAWEKFRQWKKDQTPVTMKITEAVKGGVTGYLEGMRAFIPASKLSLSYVEDLSVFVGQTVQAIVITAEEEGKKLVLSCRELLQEEARNQKSEKAKRLQIGAIVNGKVESLKDYGAFVDIGEGMSGLLHISQIPYHKKLPHPKYVLKEGQEIKVKITKVENGKVSLSMKDLADPMDKEVDEAPAEYHDKTAAGTSMGDLLKKLGL